MGLTLAEKPIGDVFARDEQICDLESPTSTSTGEAGSVGDDEVPLAQLLSAAALLVAVALLLWAIMAAIRVSLRRLPSHSAIKRRWPRLGSSGGDSATGDLYDSPPTPPPIGWLRDADSASPSFMTPPVETLLFSVSPAAGVLAAAAQQPAGLPYSSYGGEMPPSGRAAHVRQHPVVGSTPGGLGGGGAGRAGGGMGQRSCGGAPCGAYGSSGGAAACAGAASGWDCSLLAKQSAMLPAISSVEGLMADPAFQEFMRSNRGRSPALARDQSQAKVQLYKELRRLDPDGFKRLLSRTDIKSYDVQRPHPALAVVDYLLGAVALPGAAIALACSPATAGLGLLSYCPIILWLASRLWLAASGHTSLLGRVAGMYLVYDVSLSGEQQPAGDRDQEHRALGNAWEHMAGPGGHILLALFELCMAACSLGLLVVGSLVSIAANPKRQTLAMRLLGLRLEREVCRQTTLSPFSPVSESTSWTPSPGSSAGRVYRQTPGRYGLAR